MQKVKILTWNLNGLFNNKETFLDFLIESQADIFCIQEVRAAKARVEQFNPDGYSNFACESERKRFGGCAVYYKNEYAGLYRNITASMDAPKSITENGRAVLLESDSFFVLNIYLKNNGTNNEYSKEKIESMKWLTDFVKFLKTIKPIIVCGDINVAAYYRDEIRRKQHKATAGFSNDEQQWYKLLINSGFTDVLTYKYPDEDALVEYLDSRAKETLNFSPGDTPISNGHRLDYILISSELLPNFVSCEIHTEHRRSKSDWHLPIEAVFEL